MQLLVSGLANVNDRDNVAFQEKAEVSVRIVPSVGHQKSGFEPAVPLYWRFTLTDLFPFFRKLRKGRRRHLHTEA